MNKAFGRIAALTLLSVAAHAATVNTTITIAGSAGSTSGNITLSGTVSFSGGLNSTGTLNSTFSLTSAELSGQVPLAITLTGGSTTGTLTGTFTANPALLAQVILGLPTASGPGTLAFTGGTGGFNGATGNFIVTAAGTGSGNTGSGTGTFSITGPGTLTFSGGTTTPTPAITAAVNNYSFIPPGFPNSGISPGSILVLTGANLADPNAAATLQDSTKVLPTTLNGASLSVTVGGTTVHPAFYYAIAGQVAVVLPASTPTGTATAVLSYNNTPSASFTFQVVPAAPGIGTYNGLAIATNQSYQLITYTNSAKPGDYVTLWGSGFGGITADSDTSFTSSPHASPIATTVYVGGIAVTPLYTGDSGFPGLDQVNVQIPQSVLPGCDVSIVAVSGSGANLIASNATAIAIAPNGGVCSDSAFGINGTTITNLSGQSTVKTGTVLLAHSVSASSTSDAAEAVFQKTTGLSATSGSRASLGSCGLSQALTSTTPPTTTSLDAGTISVTGPNGSATLQTFSGGGVTISLAQLAAGFIPSTGGTFTFNATGGKDVGSFSAPITFPNPLLSWTNQASDGTVSRASGFDVNWTGGASGSYVEISGTSTNTTVGISGSFFCYAPVSAGTFHVPTPILLGMPSGTGSINVTNSTNFTSFTATGLDFGYGIGFSQNSLSNVTYQ